MADFNPGNTSQQTGSRSDAGFESARQKTEQLREAAVERVQHVGEETRQSLDRGKQEVAQRLRRVGSSLQSMSSDLSQDDRQVSQYAEKLRTRIDSAADYVESATLDNVVSDIEQFARRKPSVFLGGAFIAGLAAARFLKSGRGNQEGQGAPAESFAGSRGLIETDRDDLADLPYGAAGSDIPRAPGEDLPLTADISSVKRGLP